MLAIVYLLVIIIILLWFLSSPFHWISKRIPNLPPLPIFGSCLPLFWYGFHDFFMELYTKFPGEKYFGMHWLTRPTLFIKDPIVMQNIFAKDFLNFTSRGFYSNQDRDPGGGNLFFIHGQQWKEIRQKLTIFFTPAKIKSTYANINNSINKLFKIFDKHIEENEMINVEKLLHFTTADMMVQTLFSVEADTLENENSLFRKMANNTMTVMFTVRVIISIISPKLYDLFGFKAFEEEINYGVANVIQKAIELRKKENIKRNDFLQGILELLNTKPSSDEEYFPDKTKVPIYNMDSIISQLIILFEGGVESTSVSVSFLLYELALQPDLQQKCRDEINKIVPEGSEITTEHINEFTYLNAAIKEILRLHSPFIIVNRECTKTYKLPDSDLTIEKGTFIIASPAAIQTDEAYFPNPKKFIPERFLNENKEGKIQSPIYFPFGEGPRTCIGMNFALFSTKIIVSNILRRYMFTPCSKTQIPVKYSKYMFLTISPDGVWLKATKI